MTCYRVKGWDDEFETSDSRKLQTLRWFAMPTKQDGRGYCRLTARQDGVVVYGVWCAILGLAAKCEPRGTLATDGEPLDADEIALKVRLRADDVRLALDVLSAPEHKIEWLEVVPAKSGSFPGPSGDFPEMPGESPGLSGDSRRNLGPTDTETDTETITNTEHTERCASVSVNDEISEPDPDTSKPTTRKRGSVFSWLSPETIKAVDVPKLADWQSRVSKTRSPPPGAESVEWTVAAAYRARDAEEPVAFFAELVGKGNRSWIRDQDWQDAKAAVRAWRQADNCPELNELTSGLFGGGN